MTPADAIGAMLCVGFRGTGPGDPAFEQDIALLARARVGSVVLFDRDLPTGTGRNIQDPEQVRTLTTALHDRLGAIICIDQEGGRVARLTAARGFIETTSARDVARMDAPTRDDTHARQARQLADLGIDMNLAPCVDIDVACAGAGIASMDRSYASDVSVIQACARSLIAAHTREGVACCLKHFPGHGSASVDAHDRLPDISDTYDQARELGIFASLSADVPAVMVGHLLCARFDASHPASLSRPTIQGVLRDQLGFDGVVITDSLDMGAIVTTYGVGEAAVMGVNAGADLLVNGFNARQAPDQHPAIVMSRAIIEALEAGRIDGGLDRLVASAERVAALRQR